jgi:3-oxoacyl-[acyl-carrier-protein] synthase II
MKLPPEDVVITGMGLVSCLGLNAAQTWAGVREGRCGLGHVRALESRLEPDKGGGEAPGGVPDGGRAREVYFLRLAIREAIAQACAAARPEGVNLRAGVVLGTTLHGMRHAGEFLRTGRLEALRGFLPPAVLRGAMQGVNLFGRPFTGPSMTTCAACSSGLSSIGLAITLIDAGELDLVIAGGYDPVSEYAHAGFDSLRVVATGPVRPFCRGREGMKVSEGYGILILERASSARVRGVAPLASVRGYGESSDAHHLTLPHPAGDGAARAIERALERAGARPEQIGLIAAHATATPNNDAAEYAAFAKVFGAALPSVPVVAFKSHLGHTLGGAGAVELILSVLAMREGLVPPTAGIGPSDIEFENLALNTGQAHRASIGLTLNTSLGFGGANTCVIAGPAGGAVPGRPTGQREVVITGIGVIVPGAVGNTAFKERLSRVSGAPAPHERGPIPESAIERLIATRRVRRMSEYVKLTLAATALAIEDAGVAGDPAFVESCSAILGTTHGSTGFSEAYYGQIVREGPPAANPVLFAEGVPNAASAQLSLMLGLKGGCQTILGTRTAGLDALRLASMRIASGEWDRAIVGGGEEHSELVDRAYVSCDLCSSGEWTPAGGEGRGFLTGAGAVVMVLESRAGAETRGQRIRAVIGRSAGQTASDTPDRATGMAAAVAAVLGGIGPGRNPVLGSANATWLDSAEAAGARRLGREIGTLYGWIPEVFSAGPLAAVVAIVLGRDIGPLKGLGAGVDGVQTSGDCDVICSDYSGSVAGVRIAVSV